MTSYERFMCALEFRTPDRIPRRDYFLGVFPDTWRAFKRLDVGADPMDYYGIDITVMVGNEEFIPGRTRIISEDAEYETWVDGWAIPGSFRAGTAGKSRPPSARSWKWAAREGGSLGRPPSTAMFRRKPTMVITVSASNMERTYNLRAMRLTQRGIE